jgi:Cd2+/Zn2+-exporting ATPase
MPGCTTCELHAESTFRIEGMCCREELALIERRFRHLPGLEAFTADLMGQRIHVKYDAAKLSTSAITAAVADAGMSAWLEHEEPVASGPQTSVRQRLLALSGAALAAGLGASLLDLPPLVSQAAFAVSVVAGAPFSARKAWHAVRLRSLDINVLMLVAVAGAIALGEWSEAAAVIFLFAVAQTLEARTMERARRAVRALMDLTPADVVVRGEAGSRRVPIDRVVPGDVMVVKPGEKVPLDGTVVEGTSAVNQAPVTGESLPADKGPGDDVFAGTINGRGALDVRVTRLQRDSTVARIIHLVEQAQAERAPSQTFVERFARIYTPAVIALAALIAIVPPLAAGAPWDVWVYRALVLLVVSCPCALVISTPVSIVAALAGAARKGVLIKGGAHLERAARVRVVAFDKTRTLTLGRPEVRDVTPLNGAGRRALLGLAAAVEQRSEHPFADAILRRAAEEQAPLPPVSDVSSLVGLGASGRIDGANVLVGSHRLFEQAGLCTPEVHARLDQFTDRGLTPVLVARDQVVVGILGVADAVRDHGRDVVDLLRRQGIRPVVMLTGDLQPTAAAVGRAVGVDEVRAELMPDDKVAAVRDLRERHGAVAMVGDGINDAPALAAADVGIVMGAVGSDAALETADIALMADELLKVPYALRLSRATVRNIQVNLGISLVMKAGFVAAAALGVATLWMAILADTGASIIVVANALRLLRAD